MFQINLIAEFFGVEFHLIYKKNLAQIIGQTKSINNPPASENC